MKELGELTTYATILIAEHVAAMHVPVGLVIVYILPHGFNCCVW